MCVPCLFLTIPYNSHPYEHFKKCVNNTHSFSLGDIIFVLTLICRIVSLLVITNYYYYKLLFYCNHYLNISNDVCIRETNYS